MMTCEHERGEPRYRTVALLGVTWAAAMTVMSGILTVHLVETAASGDVSPEYHPPLASVTQAEPWPAAP